MQAELLRDVTPPPSYEESVHFKQLIDQIKTQRRKTPPPSYNSKHIFEWIEKPPLVSDSKSPPSPPESETSDNEEEPIHERLERVSSNLLQMIEAAKQSLTSHTDVVVTDVEDNLSHHVTSQRINRKKSLERLRSSQTSLARTIDQLNISIIQHVITTNDTQSPQLSNNPSSYHHHHHHYHHHYPPKRSSGLPPPKKPTVAQWTHLLSQTALVFSICHHLFSWSKTTSSVASAAWLISLLWAKRKLKSPGALLTSFRQQ